MAGSALLTLYRSLTRHRLYAILNIGGLALGLAVFLVLFLFVQFERGYDRVLPGANKIWAVNTTFDIPGFPNVNISSTADTLGELQADFPNIVGARLSAKKDVAVKNGNAVTNEDIDEVDPAFFDLFPFPAIEGDPIAALRRPDAAVITESAARKYLGESSAVGKTITVAIEGHPTVYRIGAVLQDMPKDMTYTSDIFVPLPKPAADEDASSLASATVFLRLADAAAAQALQRQLPAFVDRHGMSGLGEKASDFMTMTLVPLTSIHLIEPKDKTVVATLGVVGVLTLLIAIVNYINLATARAGLRAREVAVRKVLGGTRRSLIAQFLIEAIAMVTLATLIALAAAEVALPFVNTIGGTSLGVDYWGPHSILIPLVVLILVVGGIAGLYPAFVLSRFRPAAVLASARTPGGGKTGARLRQTLVVLQFAIAIAFTIGTGVLVAQTQHLRSADLGFDRDGLILVPSFMADGLDDAQRADLLRAFSTVPGVKATSLSTFAPAGGSFTIMRYKDDKTGRDITVETVKTGPGFFRTYGAHLLAGRYFDRAHAGDDETGMSADALAKSPRNVIVNQTAIKELGFASPADAIGKPAKLSGTRHPTIIGVVADMRFSSPRNAIQPVIYHFDSQATAGRVPTIRAAPDAIPAVTKRLEAAWTQIAPAVPFRATSVDQQLYKEFYQNDAQRGRLFTLGAVLAVIIGCIGLYGLASFDTARRVKEIGIRKTLGASTRDIMRLLIGQFLRPVLLANLIAWPLAFFAMRKWLAGFDDRVALSPLFFIAATLIAIGIAAATVFGQAWRVARAEPARALRYE